MAIENVLRIDLADERRIRFECRGCGTLSSAPPSATMLPLRSCPSCSETWIGGSEDPNVERAVRGIGYLAGRAVNLNFILRLEVLAPGQTPSPVGSNAAN